MGRRDDRRSDTGGGLMKRLAIAALSALALVACSPEPVDSVAEAQIEMIDDQFRGMMLLDICAEFRELASFLPDDAALDTGVELMNDVLDVALRPAAEAHLRQVLASCLVD